MPWTPRQDHLNDGAYVTQDPGGDPGTLWLYADRDGIRHQVAIDEHAWRALKRFVAEVWPHVETGQT